ncbi:MAG: sensor histidine kinase [Bdellovibrionia bacterium]
MASQFYYYILGVIVLGLIFSVLIFKWFMSPFVGFKEVSKKFLEHLSSGDVDFQKGLELFEQQKNKTKYLSDSYHSVIRDYYHFLIQISTILSEFNRRSYQLSHEIKTPLAILNNEIHELSLLSENAPERGERVKTLKQRVRDLNLFIQKFEQYARAELPQVDTESLFAIEVEELLQKTVKDLEQIYPDRIKVGVFSGFKQRLIVDPSDVEQLLINLIGNAIKHTSGEVFVGVENQKIVIRDSGSGLPSSVQKNLGKPFNRASEAVGTKSSGYGLGLSICIALAQKNGWSIKFYSSLNGLHISLDFFPEAAVVASEVIVDSEI